MHNFTKKHTQKMPEVKIVFSRHAPVANLEKFKVECSSTILQNKPTSLMINCRSKLFVMYPKIIPECVDTFDISTR